MNRTITNAYSGAQYTLSGPCYAKAETYDGLAGVDTLLLTFAAELLELNLDGSPSLANLERIIARDSADVIDFSYASWLLGAVLIDGGCANDVIQCNAGNDTRNNSDGDDWLDGGPGNDILRGQNDNDYLYGGDGDDDLGAAWESTISLAVPAGISRPTGCARTMN